MNILAAIPCFNEEIAIGTVVLKARKHVDKVLVVDDGSTDSTAGWLDDVDARYLRGLWRSRW